MSFSLFDYLLQLKKKITFDDLVAILPTVLAEDRDTTDELVEAFKIFDKDGNGYISIPELRHIYCNMGEKFTDEEWKEVEEALSPGGQMVAYEDFAKMILS